MSRKYCSDYQYMPADCNVTSQAALNTFRAKRDEWLHWLAHDEPHAVSKQINGMLWADAMFRLVNSSRKHAHRAAGTFATQSGILARALDRGYVAEQIIAFRRLMEPAAARPEKQVISLRRLIDDLREHRHLLTREMFVCHDGLPFNDRGGIDDLPPPNEKGISVAWADTSGPRAYGMSRHMHETFDGMMDRAPIQRDRSDQIGDAFFGAIENALGAAPFVKLTWQANKMLLHAADDFSRGGVADSGVTLNDVWMCHQAILKVANRVSIAIGGWNIGAVPVPQFDVLEHWDAPFAPKEAFISMMEEWCEENRCREEWTQEMFQQ